MRCLILGGCVCLDRLPLRLRRAFRKHAEGGVVPRQGCGTAASCIHGRKKGGRRERETGSTRRGHDYGQRIIRILINHAGARPKRSLRWIESNRVDELGMGNASSKSSADNVRQPASDDDPVHMDQSAPFVPIACSQWKQQGKGKKKDKRQKENPIQMQSVICNRKLRC